MNNTECILIEEALAMNSRMPMKQVHSCVVCTKNHFFVVPTKTVGMFVIFDSIKNHQFFDGMSIIDGLKKMIADAENVESLENQLRELLQNDDKYIYNLSEAKSWNIKGFFGKKTLQYRMPRSWASFSVKTKAESKVLAEFYAN